MLAPNPQSSTADPKNYAYHRLILCPARLEIRHSRTFHTLIILPRTDSLIEVDKGPDIFIIVPVVTRSSWAVLVIPTAWQEGATAAESASLPKFLFKKNSETYGGLPKLGVPF